MTPQEFAEAVAAIESVQTVTLPPDAVLVVRVEWQPTPEEAERMRTALGRLFPDNEMAVLTPGMTLEAVQP